MNKKIKAGSMEEAAFKILNSKSTIQEASSNQDAEVAYDLVLWIENDPNVYRKLVAIVKNIQKKMKSGKYNHLQAPKLWMSLVDDGVKSYTKEMKVTPKEANETFTKKIKLAVSNTLADKYKKEIEDQDGKMFEEVELEENLISQIAKKTGKNAKSIASDLKKHLGFSPSSDPYYWDVLTAESPDEMQKKMKQLGNVRGSKALENLKKVVGKMMESEIKEAVKVSVDQFISGIFGTKSWNKDADFKDNIDMQFDNPEEVIADLVKNKGKKVTATSSKGKSGGFLTKIQLPKVGTIEFETMKSAEDMFESYDDDHELEEATEVEITSLDKRDQQFVRMWSKIFNARADYAFDGIHGKIIVLQSKNSMGSPRITKEKLIAFLKGPDFRWFELDDNGEITIGF